MWKELCISGGRASSAEGKTPGSRNGKQKEIAACRPQAPWRFTAVPRNFFRSLEKRRFPAGHRIVQNPGARSGRGHRRPRHPPVSPRPGFRHVGGRSFAPCVLECDFALDTAAGGRQDRKRRRRTRCPATSRQEPQTKPPMFKTPAVRPSPGGQYRIVMP